MDIFYPVTAIDRDGKTRVINTADALREFCRTHRDVGAEWAYYPTMSWTYRNMPVGGYPMAWILRDDRGRPVDPHKDLEDARSDVTGIRLYYYGSGRQRGSYAWRDDVRRAMEKGLPIPGVHKRSRRKCRCRPCCGGSIQEARFNGSGTNNHQRYDAEDNARENGIDLW